MQCLGAREISIDWKKGKNADEFSSHFMDMAGDTSYKSLGANANYESNQTTSNTSINKQ
jgi:hypothetical protein